MVVVNRKTAAYYYHRLREIIAYKLAQESNEFLSGEIEVDESYFGGHRKGKRGRGAGGKVPVFGLLKRGGKVYTKVIPNAKASTLMPIIREKLSLTVLFIQIVGVDITCLMCQSLSTIELIIRSCLLISTITLME